LSGYNEEVGMRGLLERIEAGEVLVSDGAAGTMLLPRLEPGQPPEAINLLQPEALVEVAGLYVQAGADIIQTNTFGASPLKLAMHGLEGSTEQINSVAVEAARSAAGPGVLVSASVGPSGQLLIPFGPVTPEQMSDSFRSQIEILARAGVDVIIIETMTDPAEARLAVEAARRLAPELPVVATMTFDPTPRGFYTIMGTSVAEACDWLRDAGADVIGSNCGNGIENMVLIARQMKSRTELPLAVQSNAGLPKIVEGKTVFTESPQFIAEKARELVQIGVAVIGGCCGTTPEHIRALREMVDGAAAEDAPPG